MNENFDPKYHRRKDILQIRYQKDGELARALQACFYRSFHYIKEIRENRDPSIRTRIRVPDEMKEYLAIYTTEYDDCYVLETIAAEDLRILRSEMDGQPERVMEAAFNYDVKDEDAGVAISDRHVKIRKLNQKIGENLTFQRRRMMYVYPNGAEQKIVLNRHL